MHKKRIGIYPGTFDPMTNGHVDILIRSKKIVDELIVAVAVNHNKGPIFSTEARCEMVQYYLEAYGITQDITIMSFDGLLADFAYKMKTHLIIRGIRVMSDFDYEFQMACMNTRLAPQLETILLPASERSQFISSRLVREIASLGGDIAPFVIPPVEAIVNHYYRHYRQP